MSRSYMSVIRFVVLLSLLFCAQAFADGMFVWRNRDSDIREPRQKALIVHEDGQEDLVLSVRFEGAVDDFGWLVPLPSRPRMDMASGPVFEILSKTMQGPFIRAGESFGMLTRTLELEEAGVHATHHEIGLYDVTLLDGGDGASLGAWLESHEFILPDGAPDVLDRYAQRGWTLAAIRIDPDRLADDAAEDLKNGEIQPIHFSFATAQPVFPLEISSLNGNSAELLLYVLADRPRRPATDQGISWQVSLKPWKRTSFNIDHVYRADPDYDPDVLHLSESDPSFMRDLYGRFFSRADELWLTKCRATVAPEEMVDVLFEDVDIVRDLDSEDLQTRVEAISYLGQTGASDAADLLVAFLERRDIPRHDLEDLRRAHEDAPRPGQDLRSCLWALGELGDPCAVPVLRRWATSGRPLYAIDALEALGRLDTSAACGLAVEIVERGDRVTRRAECSRVLYKLALDIIIRHGDWTSLPSMRRLVHRYIDPNLWNKVVHHPWRDDRDLGADAVAMAAACGGARAVETLVGWLVDDAATWCAGLEDGDSSVARGSVNHYPRFLYPLMSATSERMAPSREKRVVAVFETLAERPAVRDRILRRAAADEGLSGFARATLISKLVTPTPDDIDLLKRLWAKARREPRRVRIQYSGNHESLFCPFPVSIDLDASAVGYALVTSGGAETLLRFWEDIPMSEADLKGELLVALSMRRMPGVRPPAVHAIAREYIRSVWTRRYEGLNPAVCLSKRADRTSSHWPYRNVFDAPHRTRALDRLFGFQYRTEAVKLLEDESLIPAIRLYWLTQCWSRMHREDPERLDQLLGEISSRLQDPVLLDLCTRISARVVELEGMRTDGTR